MHDDDASSMYRVFDGQVVEDGKVGAGGVVRGREWRGQKCKS